MTGNLASSPQSPSPVPFAFKDHEIRTVVNGDGKPWFVAKDVCAALTVPWRGQETLRLMPAEWVGVRKLRTPNETARGGLRGDITVIAEPAVYKLAFRSNKPEADEFTNWVASEVLPAIRKTGGFQAVAPTGHLSPDQQQHIRNLVAARAKALPHGGGFPQIWERVKNRFGVARYQDIPASQFEAVVEYLLKMELKASEPKALPPARTSSTVRDYAAIYKDLPSDASRWKDLKSRLFQASNAYGRELAAIRELAREPFRMSRKSDIATLFDSVLDPIDTLFQAAESSEHAVFCHVNAALNGYMAAHEFLTRG